MSFFLVFLAIVLAGAVLWTGVGLRSRKTGRQALPALLDGGFEQPPANLPPVLLPVDAAPRDVDRVRFALGLRGYRMDQVDQVLDELRDQLAAARQESDELRSRLQTLQAGAGHGDSQGEVSGVEHGKTSDGGTAPSAADVQ
ncbi:DivIVA domain-containing protein [Pseudarthrobacter chlorophenolicus]|uniref:DivIVA domain-containing protein n=1 Tax=Pseudarthrobacter chlorophenolicus TaxID=85085 RepID=UPI0005F2EB18|nr:DivIVA domain-containing protein [Pseudarthrobacter chlorophenolicus]